MSQQEDYINFVEVGRGIFSDNTHDGNIDKQPIPGEYESLLDEMKSKCNPANFMRPYDKEKINIANKIYEQVLRIGNAEQNTKTKKELRALRKKANQKLGIRFSTKKLYELLTKACNIENFTHENYDAQKVRQANEFYSSILENADDIEALERIEQEASIFIEEYNKNIVRVEEKEKEKEDETKGLLAFSFIFILLVFVLVIIATANR